MANKEPTSLPTKIRHTCAPGWLGSIQSCEACRIVALPPTLPAPASVALLDQEDLDEMAGHLANLENMANEQAAAVAQLRRRADEIDAHSRINRGIVKRIRAMLAERAEATSRMGHCYFDAAHGFGECAGPGNCVCKCKACAEANK